MGADLEALVDDAPQWVLDLARELDRRSRVNAECSHERSAYSDAALLVKQYYEEAGNE